MTQKDGPIPLHEPCFAGNEWAYVKKCLDPKWVSSTDFAYSNYWLNVLLLDRDYACKRDDMLEITNSHGIQTRPSWQLMHGLPIYNGCPRMDLSIAEDLESRLINIQSRAVLGETYAGT